MRRRISLIVGAILTVGTLVGGVFLGTLTNAPKWFDSPAYYGLVFTALILGFVFLFIWNETGEKTDIDELAERMEQLFERQTLSIDRLTKEIRKERRMWNARFKK